MRMTVVCGSLRMRLSDSSRSLTLIDPSSDIVEVSLPLEEPHRDRHAHRAALMPIALMKGWSKSSIFVNCTPRFASLVQQ